MGAVLTIDVGTGSTRAALVDRSLKVLCLGVARHSLRTPQPGRAEQDPGEIVAAVDQAVGQCVRSAPAAGRAVAGIGVDTALHSLVALDEDFAPLTAVWTWADLRAAAVQARLASEQGRAAALYARTGCPLHASFLPAKLTWLRENEPVVFERARTFTSLKGLVLHYLTGNRAEDLGVASASGLLDTEQLAWDEEALRLAGVARDRLPDLVEPLKIVGPLRAPLAERWGISRVPVVAGGGDGPLANVGAGAVGPDTMAISIGTSGAVRMCAPRPVVDEHGRTWCYYLADRTWVVGGAISGGGGTLNWFLKAFPGVAGGPRDGEDDRLSGRERRLSEHERLSEMAARIPPGAEGLIVAPYLAGERNPGLRSDARGYLVGLGLHHSAAHVVRAIMEGVALQLAVLYRCVTGLLGEPTRVRLTGGSAGSATWAQILADVLGREVHVVDEREGSLLGCAALTLDALALAGPWRELAGAIPVRTVLGPDRAAHRHYAGLLGTYQRLYEALEPHFPEVWRLQAGMPAVPGEA